MARRGRPVIGTPVVRVEGAGKVDGSAVYPQDRPRAPGTLHAATVRAPVAAARLLGIDAGRALATRGVVRVLTARDVAGTNRFGLIEADQPVLVEDRIRGASDVVALVIATSARAARTGARRVRLALRRERPLVDPARACDAHAPVIHPERHATADHPNIVAAAAIRRGDVDRAFARAAVVIEGAYTTGFVEHAFLAPESGTAAPDADGRLTLHVATQWPEEDLRQAARALGESIARLRIVQQTVGGAFGGREDVSLQILLLLAARVMSRPVTMTWDRAESIRGHGKRHPFRIRHALAADARGHLTGARIEILADAGCYASTSRAVLDNAITQACGPYAIPNVAVDARAVYTNNPYTGAFRGFGVNQVGFAMEQQMNKLAAALGLDPAALRRRSFVRPGGRLANGAAAGACRGLPLTLTRADARARRRALPRPRDGWVYGRGIASALKNVGYSFGFDDHATARVTRTPAGVDVAIGVAEVGQGVLTVLAQIAAATLCLPVARVQMVCEDTAAVPEGGSSSASRQTFVAGNAVRRACLLLRARGARRAQATFHAPRTQPVGHPRPTRLAYAHTWSSCVADVGVDLATGVVRVLRVVNAVDAGRVINPTLFTGQVEGGVVMGQGYALQEVLPVADGMPLATGLDACRLPTSLDAVPTIETIAIESPEPAGPFGARGIGEITMIPVVPAITAAIHAATGVWIDSIPARPERILAALAARPARS